MTTIEYVRTTGYHTHVIVDPTVLGFHQAAKDGDLAKVQKCISTGLEVDCRDGYLNTPLYFASTHNHLSIVKFLVSVGANPFIQNSTGHSPLSQSAGLGHLDIFLFLLSSSSSSSREFSKDEASDLLLKACVGGNVEIIKECIALGGKVNEKAIGETEYPLMRAASYGHVEAVKFLVSIGAKVDVKDLSNESAIMKAAYNGHANVIKELVGFGANPNATAMLGQTPLIMAATQGKLEAVQELIKCGAKVNKNDGYFGTAKDWAKSKGHTDVVDELNKYKSGCIIQ